jgi:hypothetical protein
MVIWYIFHVLVCCTKKNLATLLKWCFCVTDDEKPFCSNVDASTEIASFLNKLTIVINR